VQIGEADPNNSWDCTDECIIDDSALTYVITERKHYEGKIFKKMPDFYQLDEIQAERDEAERRRKETESAVDVEALLAASDD